MNRFGRCLAAGLMLSLVIAACANPDRPSVQADTVALPTPLRTFDAELTATISQLEAAVTAVGSRIAPESRPYRPSEPQSLLQTPRVVLRADLADPDDGFVIVYDLTDAASASSLGRALADYLGSGFGQTNYSPDTQFSVATVGDTIVFTSWSGRRSTDPQRAEAIFDAVAAVGEAVEVRK